MKINYIDKPETDFKTLIERYSNMYLVLDDVLSSGRSFRLIYQDILDILKYGFEHEIIRHKFVRFKIHEDDDKIYELQMNHFLSNMILWYTFVEMDNVEVMTEEHIFNFQMSSLNDIVVYINEKILPICNLDQHFQNKIIDDIAYHMRAISTAFSPIMGMGMSIHNIYKMEEQFPEISELMYGSIDPTLQPVEIEKILHERTDRIIELFSETDNDLRPLFLSGKNLSKDQFKEIVIKIGLKADINGNTIPYLIDCNILVNGINKPSFHFLEAMSARKSLVLSKTKMGDPGAFSKKINNNTNSAVLRKDYEVCDSLEFVNYNIKNDQILKLLDKRYYVENGELKLLNYFKDKHLIGKCLAFKSPATCSSKEGICHICYGDLYEINKDLFSVGAFAA